MEPYLDWFNIMTYDIRKFEKRKIHREDALNQTLTIGKDGVWDAGIDSLGPYAHAHTNLTEIQMGLELLWRNNINPGRVVLGLGFYGRSMFFALQFPEHL